MVASNPDHRSLIGTIGAHARWAREDPSEGTKAARQVANVDRWDKLVDPYGQLSAAERSRRADHARRAHMRSLALKSAQARRARAQGAK